MILTTERLVLREFREDDWPAVHGYHSDPRYLRCSGSGSPTERDSRAFVGMFLEHQRERPRWRWQLAIVLREGGPLIGNCGLRRDSVHANSGNIGYELDPEHWGRGHATEAARELLRFGIEGLGLRRLWARVVAENTASIRVLERLGLQLEERRTDAERFHGRSWDVLIYGWTSRS